MPNLAAALVQATETAFAEGIVSRKTNNAEQEQRLIEDIVGCFASDSRPFPPSPGERNNK